VTTPTPWFKLPSCGQPARIAIVGAGVAGCSVAYELHKQGCAVTLIDQAPSFASAASKNPRAVLKPHVNRSGSILNHFYQQAFFNTLERLQVLQKEGYAIEHALPGVVQLLRAEDTWPELDSGQFCTSTYAKQLMQLHTDGTALYFPQGGWINAQQFCHALVADAQSISQVLNSRVSAMHRDSGQWVITVKGNRKKHIECDAIVLAAGAGSKQFTELKSIPLTISSGQTTTCRINGDGPRPEVVITGKRYLIPEQTLCTIGSTHHRDCTQTSPTLCDDDENLRSIYAQHRDLYKRLEPISHWRALRLSTPDRLPIVGPVPDFAFYQQEYASLCHGPAHKKWQDARYLSGAFVLTGLGTKGAVSATLCAQLLSAIICDKITELGAEFTRYFPLVHPARFQIRQLKRVQCKPPSI